MLFNNTTGSDEAGLKVQFNRTKVCLQGITDEAAIERPVDKMYELLYLQNAKEVAELIEELKLNKYYPWVFSEDGDDSGKVSSRREKVV